MYFKKLTKFNLDVLSEFTDLDEDRHFIFNILINILLGSVALTFAIGCIILIPIALYDHIITGCVKLYKYIKYPNLKKIREKEIRIIIQNHGKSLLEKNDYYKLKGLENWQTSSTLYDFLDIFINHYNNQYFTIDINGNYICDPQRRRSLGDIWLISRYYISDVTIEEVLSTLIELCKDRQIYASYCTTINKYVFHNQSDSWIKDSKTEYGDVRFNELIEIYK
jgi:hypothetical protein